MSVQVLHGDCLDYLVRLATDGVRVHAVVTDPPYHLTAQKNGRAGFMGKTWDGGNVAFDPETWRRVFDVMLPGAFIVAFSSSRTFGRMSVALEDAGFITHPMVGWITGQGFPKATRFKQPELDGWRYGLQALKPALEPIYMGQKPLDGTGSQNWDRHGCGGLNIDACRVGAPDARLEAVQRQQSNRQTWEGGNASGFNADHEQPKYNPSGRFPANLVHDGSDEVEAAFAAFGERPTRKPTVGTKPTTGGVYGKYSKRSLTGGGDTGSASRFFYSAKANKSDRAGSAHPTVKPTSLCRWLVQLITPPGGTVLDPFAGTGTTGVAATQLGMNAILIEQDVEYVADIHRKLASASAGPASKPAPRKARTRVKLASSPTPVAAMVWQQQDMFGGALPANVEPA